MIAAMPVIPAPVLATATLISGTLAVLSAPWAFGLHWLYFVFKPLSRLLIFAYAWPCGGCPLPCTACWRA